VKNDYRSEYEVWALNGLAEPLGEKKTGRNECNLVKSEVLVAVKIKITMSWVTLNMEVAGSSETLVPICKIKMSKPRTL
jgi:hypothetical protein